MCWQESIRWLEDEKVLLEMTEEVDYDATPTLLSWSRFLTRRLRSLLSSEVKHSLECSFLSVSPWWNDYLWMCVCSNYQIKWGHSVLLSKRRNKPASRLTPSGPCAVAWNTLTEKRQTQESCRLLDSIQKYSEETFPTFTCEIKR